MPAVGDLPLPVVREALRLLGDPQPPANRAAAVRALRDELTGPGTVQSLLEAAPHGAAEAFTRLLSEGPAPVEALLGRGWWGHGALPPPLDWLQRRALVAVVDDDLVDTVDEARNGALALTLDLDGAGEGQGGAPLVVQDAGCVVIAANPASLHRALVVADAALRAVAPTVAVSPRRPAVVNAALRSAGVPLAADVAVPIDDSAPALPSAVEDALGPRAVRVLLGRAVTERRQIWLRYFASSRGGAATERTVDPWSFADDLLRGWCHLRRGERTFAVDRIGLARLLPSAVEHPAPSAASPQRPPSSP